MNPTRRLAVAALLSLCAVACDDGPQHADAGPIPPGPDAGLSADAAAPGTDAAEPGTDAAQAGVDAAAPGADAAEPGPDATSRSPLTLIALTYSMGQYVASNAMFDTVQPGSSGRCATTSYGACNVTDCRPVAEADGGTPDTGPLPHAFAGSVNIVGAASSLTLTANEDGSYDSVRFSGERWAANEELVFLSAGSREVPRFRAVLRFPGVLEVLTPHVDNYWEAVLLPRSQPFVATWTPTPHPVWLSLRQSGQRADEDLAIFCKFEGSAGEGTIPSEVTSLLVQSVETETYAFVVHGGEVKLQAGEYPVWVQAWSGSAFYVEITE